MIKRRQSLLAVMAVVLILASIGTGYLGFVYDPGEDVPDVSPAATDKLDPAAATAPGVGTEPTAPVSDETTKATTPPPIEAGGGDAASATSGGADKAADPTGETTETTEETTNPTEAEEETTAPSEAEDGDNEIIPTGTGSTGEGGVDDEDISKKKDPPLDDSSDPTNKSAPVDVSKSPFAHTQLATEETTPSGSENTTPTVMSEPVAPPRKSTPGFRLVMQIACFVFAAGACVDLLLLAILRKNVRDHERAGEQPMDLPTPMEVHPIPITEETVEETVCPIPGISIGKIHDIGRRDYQQDSFGQTAVLRNTGILAVLADGMGGLSGGERVSQKIVMEALTFGSTLQANQVPTALPNMVAGINRAVNQMLGPKGLYTSGSTVVSALITGNALRWISVGDSRVYLYRDGQLSQLSRDHDLLQDWMPDILEGKRSMAEALRDPDGRKLTSFIGMGELRHVDYNRTPIPLLPGDRVLLMSDGVYGTVSDADMAAILRDCGSVQLAASHIGQRIMGAALPYQDNYTLIVLGYDPSDQPRNNR